jgi:hypothetical protein
MLESQHFEPAELINFYAPVFEYAGNPLLFTATAHNPFIAQRKNLSQFIAANRKMLPQGRRGKQIVFGMRFIIFACRGTLMISPPRRR